MNKSFAVVVLVVCVLFLGTFPVLGDDVPPGAQVLKKCDFESGTDGLTGGRHVTTGPKRGRGAFKLRRAGGGGSRHALDVDFTVGAGTCMSFWLYADGPGNLSLRLVPKPDPSGKLWKSHRTASAVPLPQRKWMHVTIPIAGTFAFKHKKTTKGNEHTPVKPGEEFTKVIFGVSYGCSGDHVPFGPAERKRFAVLDDFVLYNVGEAARLKLLRKELADLAKRVKQLPAAVPANTVRELSAAIAKTRTQVLSLAKKCSDYQISSEVLAVMAEANTCKERIERFEKHFNAAARVSGQKVPAFALGVESPTVRVTHRNPTYRFKGAVTGKALIDLARGEAESVQLVVLPLGRDLKRVAVDWTDLKPAKGGKTLPKSVLTCRLPECVFMPTTARQSLWGYRHVGWIPDPLMPYAPIDVARDEERAILLTIEAPRDAAAGEYKTTVTVRPENAQAVSMELTVRVRDFEVPLRGRMRNQTNFGVGPLRNFYHKQVSVEQRREWQVFLLKHRIQPTAQYSGALSPPAEDIPYLLKHGLNMVMIGASNLHRPLDMAKVREKYETIKRLGVLDMSVIYIADEVGKGLIPRINKRADSIHRECPGMRVMTGGVGLYDDLIGHLDIWDPICYRHPNGFDAKNAAKLKAARARGEELFWYVCCGPNPPYANVQICNALMESRVWYWVTRRFGFSGSEYWNFISFKKNVKPAGEKRWPDIPWDSLAFTPGADGNLAYPGRGGHPIASFRLENMRDGAEDWECFSILQDLHDLVRSDPKLRSSGASLLARAKKALSLSDLIARPYEFSRDPKRYQDRRGELLDTIEGLIRLTGHGRYQAFAAQRDKETLQLRRKALAAKITKAGGKPPSY